MGVTLVLKSGPSAREKSWLERPQPPPFVPPLQPTSAEQLLGMLTRGNRNRTQHPTDANATSSRSHAIFQVSRGHRPGPESGLLVASIPSPRPSAPRSS